MAGPTNDVKSVSFARVCLEGALKGRVEASVEASVEALEGGYCESAIGRIFYG